MNLDLTKNIQQIILDKFWLWLYDILEMEEDKIKCRHKRKIQNLKIKYNNRFAEIVHKNKIEEEKTEVINLTQNEIPLSIKKHLEKEPKTVTQINIPNSIQYIAQVEEIISNVKEEVQEQVRHEFLELYSRQKTIENKNKEIHREREPNIKKWLYRNNLQIIQADKSANMVLISKQHYEEKFQEMTEQLGMQQIDNNPLNLIINQVNNIRKLKYLPEDIKKNSKIPYNPRIPLLKVRIKTHKENQPLRPIVAKFTTPTFNLEKSLAEHCKSLIYPYYLNTKSSYSFVDEILKIKIPKTEKVEMYTIDVKNLYPSVNLNVAKQLILKKYKQNINDSPKIVKTIESAFNLIFKNNYAVHKNKIWLQTHGAPLGSPLSEVLAEVIVQTIETKVVTKYMQSKKILFYRRYVDDAFILWSGCKTEFEEFLSELNNIFSFISFTYETENKNKTIAFLDVTIHRYTEVFQTSIYRKPTYIPCFIPKSSKHPLRYKIAAIRTLIYRAFRLSSNSYFLNKEVNILRQQFNKLGYSTGEFFGIYKKVKNQLFPDSTLQKENSDPSFTKVFMPLQYFRPINTFLQNKLQKYAKHPEKKVEIIPIVKNNIINNIKSKEQKVENSAGIYVIPIQNENNSEEFKLYFGQTARDKNLRRSEHNRNIENFRKTELNQVSSTLVYYLKENPQMKEKLTEMEIIDTPRTNKHLLFFESVYLHLYKHLACNEPTYNISKTWLKFFSENKTKLQNKKLNNFIFQKLSNITDLDQASSLFNATMISRLAAARRDQFEHAQIDGATATCIDQTAQLATVPKFVMTSPAESPQDHSSHRNEGRTSEEAGKEVETCETRNASCP